MFTDKAVEDLDNVWHTIFSDNVSQVLRLHHNHSEYFMLWNVINVYSSLGHRYYFSQYLIKTTTLANSSPRSCTLGRKSHDGLHPEAAAFPRFDFSVVMSSKGSGLSAHSTEHLLIDYMAAVVLNT